MAAGDRQYRGTDGGSGAGSESGRTHWCMGDMGTFLARMEGQTPGVCSQMMAGPCRGQAQGSKWMAEPGKAHPGHPQRLGACRGWVTGTFPRGRWAGGLGRRKPHPPRRLVGTQYLSKGRGLPRRLDTTASQCWVARRHTLC